VVSEAAAGGPAAVTDDQLVRARMLAADVPDPEIPVVTLGDLGILRSVQREGERIVVTLTPTYTGCPATQVIADDVRRALADAGIAPADVRLTLSPPWTTDWISDAGRRKLREYGIAPPAHLAGVGTAVLRFVPKRARAAADDDAAPDGAIACPRCASTDIERLSEYGSTPCKALYRCVACREPFDYFKPY
jgi:ring-1,2-phenylacetyl-CoA epoxidase subunit PaaD